MKNCRESIANQTMASYVRIQKYFSYLRTSNLLYLSFMNKESWKEIRREYLSNLYKLKFPKNELFIIPKKK
jgi:hypothetical protein